MANQQQQHRHSVKVCNFQGSLFVRVCWKTKRLCGGAGEGEEEDADIYTDKTLNSFTSCWSIEEFQLNRFIVKSSSEEDLLDTPKALRHTSPCVLDDGTYCQDEGHVDDHPQSQEEEEYGEERRLVCFVAGLWSRFLNNNLSLPLHGYTRNDNDAI